MNRKTEVVDTTLECRAWILAGKLTVLKPEGTPNVRKLS